MTRRYCFAQARMLVFVLLTLAILALLDGAKGTWSVSADDRNTVPSATPAATRRTVPSATVVGTTTAVPSLTSVATERSVSSATPMATMTSVLSRTPVATNRAATSAAVQMTTEYKVPLGAMVISVVPGEAARLRSPDGGVTVDIPPGASATPLQIVYVPKSVSDLPPLGYSGEFLEPAFELVALDEGGHNLPGWTSAAPATIRVTLSAAGAKPCLAKQAECFLVRYQPDSMAWIALPAAAIEDAGDLTSNTRRLGLFAVVRPGTPAPHSGQPDVRRLPIFTIGAVVLLVSFILAFVRKQRHGTQT